MIPTILKTLIKDKTLLALWLSIAFLCGLTLCLSSENPLLMLASLVPKGYIERISSILLLVSIGLLTSLFVLHRKQKIQINFQNCNWLPDPGIWEHKINGIKFCPTCHSQLSSELYCAKCNRGFGKGECFTIDG